MNKRLALKILGIHSNTPMDDVRRKYKSLMILTHPDMGTRHDYPFDAADINAAYEYLIENNCLDDHIKTYEDVSMNLWDAPINENAYAEREILSFAESSVGDIAGNIRIATGKYVWTEDEEFSLFLLSIYNCCTKIIDEAETNRQIAYTDDTKEKLHIEIAYLLAGQFVDPNIMLCKYKNEDVYSIPAMLEYTGNVACKTNEIVYPKAIRKHRLYLQNSNQDELGYVSFKDDRLYYCLIPLFEARSVVLKISVESTKPIKTGAKRYSNIKLLLKLKSGPVGTIIDSINLRIDNLLKEGLNYG